MILGLIGNQNSGKTTLFNALTGRNQRVGNFPGVTVDRVSGFVKNHPDIEVVDLPGIYSLYPYSNDELVSRDFLVDRACDVVINIIDASNLSRGLYLTMQLIEMEIPIIVALNMMDIVKAQGLHLSVDKMEEMLGLPVVPISATKNEGVSELIHRATDIFEGEPRDWYRDLCAGPVHRTAHALAYFLENHAEKLELPPRYVALRLIEGDDALVDYLELSGNEKETILHMIEEMEQDSGLDRIAATAQMRYEFIDRLYNQVVRVEGVEHSTISQKIDQILMHPILAFPLFILIFGFVFWISFGGLGAFLSGGLETLISSFTEFVGNFLQNQGANSVLISLLIDGVLAGVGSVLSFLPLIIVLFFFLSILQDSGYMARVAFIMDKPLRKIGLSGESIVPMLMGFGCTVPATMATRTLSSERDRKMTIFLLPFMSCTAKVPIYAIFAAAFFPNRTALVMTILYLGGVILSVLFAAILKNTAFKGEAIPFILELPAYRMPRPYSVFRNLWDEVRTFLTRAFTIILLTTVVIWFLRSFTPEFDFTQIMDNSILAWLSSILLPIFLPLGFANWQAVTALIAGFTAKEAVVGTLAVLVGSSEEGLVQLLGNLFTIEAAISFLTFTLLYVPCVATIAAVRRELRSLKGTLIYIFGQTAIAWFIAFIVYRVSLGFTGILSSHGWLIAVLFLVLAIALFLGGVLLVVRILNKRNQRIHE